MSDPNQPDPNHSRHAPGNKYQQEAMRIIYRMHDDLGSLLSRARESGHFPDDPGYHDEYGDPINRQLDRARIAHEHAMASLVKIYRELRVEALAEEWYSF